MLKIVLLLSLAVDCWAWSDTSTRRFPKDFLFGAATAAYQVEGGWSDDGKGESIWDSFTHLDPSPIIDGSNGDISSNSYLNYKQDVILLKNIGVAFYKFSISWSRVLPNGTPDKVNEIGVAYYNSLIDELLRYRIQPMITLYHNDLPQKLQDIGGWTSDLIVGRFEDYARFVFENFGDRVKLWVTINNPYHVCHRGYGEGDFAPGVKSKGVGEYACVRNILLAHAKVWRMFDKEYRTKNPGKLGISINVDWKETFPKDSSQAEIVEEARQFYFGIYAHPIFSKSGDFPKAVKDIIARKSKKQGLANSRLPEFSAEEVDLIRGSSDFFGLSHFTTNMVYRNDSLNGSFEVPSFSDDVNVGLTASADWVRSSSDWLRSVPFGLYKALLWLNRNYDYPEIMITELGWPSGAEVRDEARAEYLRGYLEALLIGMEDGSRVQGLAVWSLLDGFEWTEGYTARFGLHEVDFSSPERNRTARTSALVYKEIIRSRTVDRSFEPGVAVHGPARKTPKQEL